MHSLGLSFCAHDCGVLVLTLPLELPFSLLTLDFNYFSISTLFSSMFFVFSFLLACASDASTIYVSVGEPSCNVHHTRVWRVCILQIACVPGSQCFNSTFEAGSGTCTFPKTMLGASKAAEPLEVALRTPNMATPVPSLVPSLPPSLHPLSAPTLAPSSSSPPNDDTEVVDINDEIADHLTRRLLSSSSPVPWLTSFLKATSTSVWSWSKDAQKDNEAVHDGKGVDDAESSSLAPPLPSPIRALSQDNEPIATELVCPGAGNMFLCKGGFYCPDAVTFIPCPEGYYCPVSKVAAAVA